MSAFRLALAAGVAAALAASPCRAGDPFDRASAAVVDLARATRATPGSAPALAVVMVRQGRAPVIWVDGVADTRTGQPAGPDTPFYVASMTKAYVGLMAAELDRRQVFDLDWRLTDVWPALKLDGADASAIRFRDLLSHQAPIRNAPLSFRTAYTDEVPAGDYPALLAAWTTARKAGFEYDNLGYLIYGAALEAKTGRHWRSWLQDTVLDPLGMTRTAPSVSRLAGTAAAEQWTGDGWAARAPKADPLMHAAGGLVTSPADMARWLAANIDERAPRLPAASFAAAHAAQVQAPSDESGIPCTSYALGWYACAVDGAEFLLHGGGYTGARSWMAVSPKLGVGVAVMANSDTVTGHLGARLVEAFFQMEAGAAGPDRQAFAQAYADLVAKQTAGRRKRIDARRAEPQWAGWSWTPDARALDAYVGRYRNPRLGEATVAAADGRLVVRLGALEAPLTPAAPDLFAYAEDAVAPPSPFRFERQAGAVAGLDWDGDRFDRAP